MRTVQVFNATGLVIEQFSGETVRAEVFNGYLHVTKAEVAHGDVPHCLTAVFSPGGWSWHTVAYPDFTKAPVVTS